jgi:LuxR family maltose regulon positive regulatory protein
MPTPILAAKFYIPAPHADLVSRPRLIRKLSEGLTTPLTLISAPAGFGKTTLITEWHYSPAGRDFPLTWLSLEAEDNDPIRFMAGLISALQTLKPGHLNEVEPLLQSTQPKVIAATLIHCLNRSISHPFALVLEDYHSITAKAVHDAVAYFISHMPPHMHLILSSRTDPPLPLSRLRVRGDLTEIRSDDLRFTHEETVAYLNQNMGLTLSTEDVDALEARTEGWIAGLKLATLSMQSDPETDLASFVSRFTGSHHYIADYLVEEVLNGQPEEVRNFLLTTSELSCLCGELCDAVLGHDTRQADGQAMLELLDQENLFIVRLDDDREWFRYHHLFGELLRHRQHQVHPGLAAELHRREVEWYEQNEMLECAVEVALDAEEFELAAGVIERIHPTMGESGQTETLSRWVQALPDGILRAHPRLASFLPSKPGGILTPRELEVLELMGKGASNREIAQSLVVTTGTVKKHLNNIFAKLEAQNRTQAVARAREFGLL